jgi:DNA-binding CsgD family transcriptional regulator
MSAKQTELTPREREILQWYADGKDGPGIAVILGIAYNTVHCTTHRMCQKLGANSTAHAVNLGWERGILHA